MENAAILLLAAGASRRMGSRDKLLEDVDGVPLLARQAKAALQTGAQVFVAVDKTRADRVSALSGLDINLVSVAEAEKGMGQSIADGIRTLPPTIDMVAILPADMPEITGEHIKYVLQSASEALEQVYRAATDNGMPGHPVVFPKRLFPELRKLTGDDGARSVLTKCDLKLVPLPGTVAITDLDTPEDWENWRAKR